MPQSIFMDSKSVPSSEELSIQLGSTFPLWKKLKDFTLNICPDANSEWKFSGEKYGWSYRISDKKRVIIYLLPRSGYFKAAFVFGDKATQLIFDSEIDHSIQGELRNAKKYSEGRGIRIDINDEEIINSITELISIKTRN